MDHAKTQPHPLRQAVKRALLSAVPPSALVASLPSRRGEIFLTFDDGPHPEHTPAVLDALAAHDARATFFVIGEHAERHPDLIRRIAAEGHSIGHHSWAHTEPAETSASVLLEEADRTARWLADATGRAPHLFRPPYGKLTAGKLFGLWRAGQTVVLWNADPKDYCAPSATAVSGWFEDHPLEGGEIVLLHDSHPQAAEALPAILAMARSRGLRARAL